MEKNDKQQPSGLDNFLKPLKTESEQPPLKPKENPKQAVKKRKLVEDSNN